MCESFGIAVCFSFSFLLSNTQWCCETWGVMSLARKAKWGPYARLPIHYINQFSFVESVLSSIRSMKLLLIFISGWLYNIIMCIKMFVCMFVWHVEIIATEIALENKKRPDCLQLECIVWGSELPSISTFSSYENWDSQWYSSLIKKKSGSIGEKTNPNTAYSW